jgi:hypothetical protein
MGRGGPSIAQTYIRTPLVSNTQFHVLIAMRAGLQRDGSRASSVWATFRKALPAQPVDATPYNQLI